MTSSLLGKESKITGKLTHTNQKVVILKIIMLGDAAVGKTSLVKRYITGSFKGAYKATLGLDLNLREIKIDEVNVRLQIWDISGQTHFKPMRQRFYSGTMGALLTFDVTRPNTFHNLQNWYDELCEFIGHVPFILVGNKIDLDDLILTDELDEVYWLAEHRASAYLRTSAYTGENVGKCFDLLAQKILKKIDI